MALRNVRGSGAIFAIGAIWLRILSDAYPALTIYPIAAGLSINAMLSILTAAVGLVVIRPAGLKIYWLMAIYVMVGSALLTHAFVGDPIGLFYQLIKYIYIAVIALAIVDAFRENGIGEFSSGLAWISAMLTGFAFIAFALGMGKASEADGSTAYVGGFGHEANFSIMVLALVIPVMAATRWSARTRLLMLLAMTVSLFLANYRTSILTAAPFLLLYFGYALMSMFQRSSRGPLIVGLITMIFIAALFVRFPMTDRIDAIVDIATNPTEQIRHPDSFTREQQSQASGRSYIWSTYGYAFAEAGQTEKIIGHGTQAWQGVMKVYPQNTLLSFLYDYGLVGAISVIIFWLALIVMAAMAPMPWRLWLLAYNGGLLLLNMSTQPLYLVEGLILYSVLFAYSLHFVLQHHRQKAAALNRHPAAQAA